MGEPGKIDAGIALVRDEIMPAITVLDGCVGLSLIVDRDSGQCIATSSWTSAETMAGSDAIAGRFREQASRVLGGEPAVESWEIAVMHRDHASPAGSCCRVTWMRLNHTDIARNLALYRDQILPAMEELEGFCSASLLVNAQAGRACNTINFDTREAMDASTGRSWAIRETGVREAGVDVIDVGEFELALAHLRVPELV
jgi:hypothetical protein